MVPQHGRTAGRVPANEDVFPAVISQLSVTAGNYFCVRKLREFTNLAPKPRKFVS